MKRRNLLKSIVALYFAPLMTFFPKKEKLVPDGLPVVKFNRHKNCILNLKEILDLKEGEVHDRSYIIKSAWILEEDAIWSDMHSRRDPFYGEVRIIVVPESTPLNLDERPIEVFIKETSRSLLCLDSDQRISICRLNR